MAKGRVHRGEEARLVERDLIDFSDREDEFLPREIIQQAGSFAIIWAVIGFVFSCWLFLGKKVGPASHILDRRAAEGQTVRKTARRSQRGTGGSGAFVPPQLKKTEKKERYSERATFDQVAELASQSQSVEESAPEKKTLATTLGGIPAYTRRDRPRPKRKKKARKPRPKPQDNSLDPSRLLFPSAENRPDKMSTAEVAQSVQRNLVTLANGRGDYYPGLVLDHEGHALISAKLAQPQYLNRIWVHDTVRRGRLLAVDREFDIALVQIEGSGFRDLPLSPAPPSGGERLVGFAQNGRKPGRVDLASSFAFGRAGFFVDGALNSKGFGTPLLTERGELAGLYVSSLPEVPGSGIHLAVDSSALYRLLRGYKNPEGSFRSTEDDALLMLGTKAENSSKEIKRGRILPGVGLSDFYLGMSEEEAERWASSPEIFEPSSDLKRWDCPAPPVSLYFARGKLVLIGTGHTGFSTMEGLATGSDFDVRRLKEEPVLSPGLVTLSGLEIGLGRDGHVEYFTVKASADS